MKLIDYGISRDYGSDFWIRILNFKKWSLLQVQIGWSDYSSWPHFQIKSGGGYGLSILVLFYKFSLDIDILSKIWYTDGL